MEEDYGYSFGQQQDDDGYDLFGFEDEGLEPEDAGVTETMNCTSVRRRHCCMTLGVFSVVSLWKKHRLYPFLSPVSSERRR